MSSRVLFAVLLIVAAYLVLPASTQAQPYGYEGVQVCGMCHKTEKSGNQLKVWQDSKHAQAFKALQSAEAKKFSANPTTDAKCLKCHVSGNGVASNLLGAKFKMEDGVQCETCHGPGSAYKSMAVMKNKADAEKKGLIVHADAEKFCKTCHNSESPTFKSFDYKTMWAKIAHPTPKG
jgi:hypothetical protein